MAPLIQLGHTSLLIPLSFIAELQDAELRTFPSGSVGIDAAISSVLKHLLRKDRIKPSAEFAPYLLEMGHFLKSQPCVESPAGNVLRINPTHQNMLAQARCPGNKFAHELTTNPLPPAVSPDMNGMLNRMSVAWPRPKFTE